MHKSILFLIIALAWTQIAIAEGSQNKMTAESHPKYETLKKEADNGYKGSCYFLAKLYEKYDQNAEAFTYWECALRKMKPRSSRSVARHLAGHYFYGIGVEADVEKAAMYYILSSGKAKNPIGWPHMENRNNIFIHPYNEIVDIPDIEEKFKAGAELAKKNVDLHEMSDAFIDSQLSRILHRIKTVKDGTWYRGPLYFWGGLTCLLIILTVIRVRKTS